MGTVVALRPTRETPHTSGLARCLDCKHEWVQVSPVGEVWLSCPRCSLTRGRYVYQHVRQNEPHWTCECGNDLFHVTPNGVYCPNCGSWQRGF